MKIEHSLYLSEIKPCAELLGLIFYYGLGAPETKEIIQAIEAAQVAKLVAGIPNRRWQEAFKLEDLQESWSEMFKDRTNNLAPPWASVYLNGSNHLDHNFLDTFKVFLHEQNVTYNNPLNESEDQIGLFLLYLVDLLEKNNEQGARKLLDEYLFSWVFRYLECLSRFSSHPFISELEYYARNIFKYWIKTYNLNPKVIQLYWPPNMIFEAVSA